MRTLKTSHLTADRVAQAYPIVQMVIPELTFEAWCRFALTLLSEESKARGIVTVNNEQDYIVGLGAYHTEQDLRDDRTLIADHFLAVDLIRRDAVAQTLAAELEGLARENGCAALHTRLPDATARPSANWLIELMKTRGHNVAQLMLRKPLTSGT